MLQAIRELFDTSDFMPRWNCGMWTDFHGWVHICADLATWGAYTAIPIVIILLIRKRNDIPFPKVMWLFALFILACGTTHFIEALIFWVPIYRVSAVSKSVMAVVSWATVFALVPLVPVVLSLRSPRQLEEEVKRRTEMLKESEARVRGIIDSVHDAVVTILADGKIIDWNRRAEETFGWTREQALQMKFCDLFSWDEKTSCERPDFLRHILAQTQTIEAEVLGIEGKRVDGTRFPVEISIASFGTRELPMYNAFVRDISRRKQSDEELRKLALVARHTENAVIITDAIGLVEWANEGFTRLTGYDLSEIRGKKPGAILQGEDSDPETVRYLGERIRLGEPTTVEIVNYAKNGRRYWVAMDVTPVHNQRGELVNFIAVETDITERKRAQEELRLAKEDAERATRAKSEFLANMSHEIRTPMTAIMGFIEVLGDPKLGEDQRAHATYTIQKNGEHLLELVNGILDLSKIEAGKLDVEMAPISVVDLVADVASLMNVQIESKGLKFDIRYDGPIPTQIETDGARLRQVLINLIGNSVKFTEAGSISLELAIVTGPRGQDELAIRIADTGIGMKQEVIDKIFEPFTQADATVTRRFGGTGLGLAICQRLIWAMHGRIHVESVVGEGTTFSLNIPCGDLQGVEWIDAPLAAMSERVRRSSEVTAEVDLSGCRILLAEDRPANQDLIGFLLRRSNAQYEIVDNGQDAVDRAMMHPFDVILMDMQMPVLDGYSASSLLRRKGYEKPIIALTAHAMNHDRDKCLKAGCTDFVSKPIDSLLLLSKIREYVSREGRLQSQGSTQRAASGSSDAVLDFPSLVQRCSGDEAFACELLASLLPRVAEELTEIGSHMEPFAGEELRSAAHAIKGVFGNLSANRLCRLAAVLEAAADQRDSERCRELLSELADEWETCRSEIQGIVAKVQPVH